MRDGKHIGGRQNQHKSFSLVSHHFSLAVRDLYQKGKSRTIAWRFILCRFEWLSVLSVVIKSVFKLQATEFFLMDSSLFEKKNSCSIPQVKIWTSITAIPHQLAGGLLFSKQIFRFFFLLNLFFNNTLPPFLVFFLCLPPPRQKILSMRPLTTKPLIKRKHRLRIAR